VNDVLKWSDFILGSWR